MRRLLDQTSALLAANANDTSSQVGQQEAAIAAMSAAVDEMARALDARRDADRADVARIAARLAALEQSETRVAAQVAPTLPEDREALWQQAGARLAAGQADEGRRFYRAFIQRFPEDPRASGAYVEIGRSLALERRFAEATAAFQKVIDAYPRSPEVPEAMWQLSRAFVELRFCSDAEALLGDLVRRYPRSLPAASAQKEMRAIKKLPRGVCTS
jgi:TolA-binding protein